MGPKLTIGAVSERTGVATSALRYYEAEGLISATRSEGGQRRYTRDVIRRVSFILVAQPVGLSLDETLDTGGFPALHHPIRGGTAPLSPRRHPAGVVHPGGPAGRALPR